LKKVVRLIQKSARRASLGWSWPLLVNMVLFWNMN